MNELHPRAPSLCPPSWRPRIARFTLLLGLLVGASACAGESSSNSGLGSNIGAIGSGGSTLLVATANSTTVSGGTAQASGSGGTSPGAVGADVAGSPDVIPGQPAAGAGNSSVGLGSGGLGSEELGSEGLGGTAGSATQANTGGNGTAGSSQGGMSGAANSATAGSANAQAQAGSSGSMAGAGGAETSSGGAGGGPMGASGAASGGSGGDSAADPGYQPCPESGPCKIMPFGDSITEGCCDFNGGYRPELFTLARQAGQEITFVGSASNGPAMVDGVSFPRNHEGHGGYTIDDEPARNASGISPLVDSSMANYSPDIVTLMIGTNDINGNIDVPDAPNRLGSLLDRIFSADPDVLVILAQIVPTTNDGTNQAVQTYNAAMPDLVASRTAMGRHLILIDMYEALARDADYKSSLFADGLHPNTAGYVRMAETWYAAVAAYLR